MISRACTSSPILCKFWAERVASEVAQPRAGRLPQGTIADLEPMRTPSLAPDEVFVRLSGEYDLATATDVYAAIEPALMCTDVTAVRLDLSDVTFFDCAAIGELLRVRAELRERGHTIRITAASRPVVRILTLTGLLATFGL